METTERKPKRAGAELHIWPDETPPHNTVCDYADAQAPWVMVRTAYGRSPVAATTVHLERTPAALTAYADMLEEQADYLRGIVERIGDEAAPTLFPTGAVTNPLTGVSVPCQ